MDTSSTTYLNTEIGTLVLEFKCGVLCSLSIERKDIAKDSLNPVNYTDSGSSIENTVKQLKEYFSKSSNFRKIDLSPAGTVFQQTVWQALQEIPRGETRTYGQIAKKINSSARAVGNACRKNPIAIIIPCHRVVAANGMGGYAGETEGDQLMVKKWLLKHEGADF
ncbi:MAG: methylated-DNA--[protein]-cysteine S-methyltransferase [Gammaproteobacteria bacterium]|nr:methylated-DNA--[protein]-cysteine S-methyltransferase [Gammaproteobacteria bacterium]